MSHSQLIGLSGLWVGGNGTCLVLEGVPAFPVLVQQSP
jgi:hypothetical protein